MFVAMSMIPAGDTFGKILTQEYLVVPAFVAMARYVVGASLVVPFAPRGTYALLKDWRIWLRGLSLAFGIICILTALSTAPLASVFAAFFVGPLISYVISALFLGEHVTPARTAMVVLGFVGVLMVVRPGFEAPPGIGFAVMAGALYGIYLTLSRTLSALGPPRALLATQMIVGLVVLVPLGLPHMPEMTWNLAALFICSGIFSAGGNFLLIVSYRIGTATALAPFVYFQLIAAVILGWWVFGDLPDLITLAGMAVIVGAGIASARLARQSFTALRPDRA